MEKRPGLTAMTGVLIVVLLAGAISAAAAQTDGGIQWLGYTEGRRQGEARHKKIFLVFNADWCRYCLQMEKETFQDSTVIAYINRNFIPISVNSDQEKDIAAKYNVSGLPSTWFIAENGNRIGNRPGFIAAEEMLKILKYIGSDSYLTMSYQAFLKTAK